MKTASSVTFDTLTLVGEVWAGGPDRVRPPRRVDLDDIRALVC